jgi:hypothetical protein
MSMELVIKSARRKALVDGVATHLVKSAKIGKAVKGVGEYLMQLIGKGTKGVGRGLQAVGAESAGKSVSRAGSKVKRKAGLSRLVGAEPKSPAFIQQGPKSFKGGLERMNPAHFDTAARLDKLQPDAESAGRLATAVGGGALGAGGAGLAAILAKVLGGGKETQASIEQLLVKKAGTFKIDEVRKLGLAVLAKKQANCGKKHGGKRMKYKNKKKAALLAVKIAARRGQPARQDDRWRSGGTRAVRSRPQVARSRTARWARRTGPRR